MVGEPRNGTVEEEHPYVLFLLADEQYAIDLLEVQEFIAWRPLTRLPTAPPVVLGMLELHGLVLPVLDLRRLFGLEVRPPGRHAVIAVVELLGRVLGFLVDAVREVVRFGPADLRPPPAVGSRIRTDFIRAVVPRGDRLVVVLDLDHVLTAEQLEVVDGLG